MRPIAHADREDTPGAFDQGVPGIAAVIDDVVEGFEDPGGRWTTSFAALTARYFPGH